MAKQRQIKIEQRSALAAMQQLETRSDEELHAEQKYRAAAHATAAVRDEPRDWWALAWLRGTEIATDVVWSASPAMSRPGAKAGLWLAGAFNLAVALGFARLGRST